VDIWYRSDWVIIINEKKNKIQNVLPKNIQTKQKFRTTIVITNKFENY